jgi:hypothetical protein
MRPIRHKRLKQGHSLQEQIAQALHHRLLFLPLRQPFGEDMIHVPNIVYVPEDLPHKVFSARRGDNVI